MHMFNVSILATYKIAPLKAVVGVDQPMKATSMLIQVLTAVILSKIIYSFMHMFNMATL